MSSEKGPFITLDVGPDDERLGGAADFGSRYYGLILAIAI
jgi:hypothetical protein